MLERGPHPEALRAVVDTGARVVGVSRWLSAVSVEADVPTLGRLRERFGARAVRPVRVIRGTRPTVVRESPPTGSFRRAPVVFDYGASAAQLAQIEVDRLHARGFTGEGVRILVVDTGYDLSHPAFGRLRVVDEWDFVFDDPVTANEIEDPWYQHRHGTGVLGVVAGLDEGSLVGPAPRAEVLLAKTEWVATETRTEEDAFVFALEWGEALGADLMTASLGYRAFYDDPDSFAYAPGDLDGDTAVTTRAVDDLVALGVVAVTSAGNAGPDPSTLLTPADADSVITVAAVDSLGQVAPFSSRGPTADGRTKPDVAARGVLTLWAETATSDPYTSVNGTSLAAPLVAGAAALVLEAHPDWGPGQVREALRTTASQATAPDDAMGWGIVRAHDAVFAVEDPAYPLPLDLVLPAADAVETGSSVEFAWTRAIDLQTPDRIRYRIEFSTDADFAQVAAIYEAGTDTSRVLAFPPQGALHWRVRATDPDGNARLSPVRTVRIETATGGPDSLGGTLARWGAPVPNPTASSTRLALRLERSVRARIEIFDLAGRRVRVLVRGAEWPAGERLLTWDGTDREGRDVASGAYLVRARVRSSGGLEQEISTRITVVR